MSFNREFNAGLDVYFNIIIISFYVFIYGTQYQKVRNTVSYHYSLNPGPDSDPGPAFW
jgi:hypothetical protein